MPLNLHGRSFLKLLDFTPDEIRHLLPNSPGCAARTSR
jgi:ornithine carbamoyltransferase